MLPTPSSFLLFLTGALVLLVIPGPAVLYILSRTLVQGRLAGVVSAAGIAVGTLGHVAAAILGLSALVASSARAFYAVKYLGAAYLVFLGARMLLRRDSPAIEVREGGRSLRRIFVQGILVNLLNPKTALFFLAFLPQFVAAEAPHKAFAFMVLGLIFIFNGTLWCVGLAAFASRAASRVKQSGRAVLWINRALGGMFVYLGARIAMLQAR